MVDQNIHALALQIAQASQKYEQYMTEVESIASKYQGTFKWVESLLGEPADDVRQLFGDITDAKDEYVRRIIRGRNTLLKISQALIKLSGER